MRRILSASFATLPGIRLFQSQPGSTRPRRIGHPLQKAQRSYSKKDCRSVSKGLTHSVVGSNKLGSHLKLYVERFCSSRTKSNTEVENLSLEERFLTKAIPTVDCSVTGALCLPLSALETFFSVEE